MAKKVRWRARIKRSRGRGRKALRETVYTVASSKAQAERYIHVRHPGYSIEKGPVKDPVRNVARSARNPSGGVFAKQVEYIEYTHADDGQPYYHAFGKGVKMEALPDGSLRIFHPNRRMWVDT